MIHLLRNQVVDLHKQKLKLYQAEVLGKDACPYLKILSSGVIVIFLLYSKWINLVSPSVDMLDTDIDLLDTDLDLLDTDIFNKHFICLQNVLKKCLEDILKKS